MKSANRIDEFIKGELSEEELDTRTRELVKDFFADEDRKAKWEEVLQHKPEWQSFVKEQQSTNTAPPIEKPRKGGFLRLWPLLTVAASLLLAIWVGNYLWFNNSKAFTTDQLVAQALSLPHNYETSRSNDLDPTDARQLAGAHYQAGNYTAAIPLWRDLYQSQTANTEDIFYLAMAHLYQEEFSAAVPLFNDILQQDSRLLQREATWYLALTYLQLDRSAEARPLLQNIITNEGWKTSEAQQLLDSLE